MKFLAAMGKKVQVKIKKDGVRRKRGLGRSYRLHGLEWCSVDVDATVQGFGHRLKGLGLG